MKTAAPGVTHGTGSFTRHGIALPERSETQVQRLDVRQVIRDVLAIARDELILRGVEVDCTFEAAPPPVWIYRVQIQQVLLNLLMNATEAMASNEPRDRRLLIRTTREPGYLCVSIEDWGPGIAAGDLETIFEAFFTTKRSGLGLGLSICRSIVEAHGGTLWATNNDDRGCTFCFTLPVGLPVNGPLGQRSADRGPAS